jgi:energy-coupling factor transporter ATP-binding protein EcfA2
MAEDWLVLKRLKWAWNNRTEILDLLGKIRTWFQSDPGRGILIIGAGGVGKSTLARILSGDFNWLLDEPWRYKEDFGIEEFALKDDPKTNIVVPPGQARRRETTWVDVERNLTAGQYRGVIVVNAFGYHTLADISYKEHPLFTGSKESFLATYLEACRCDELAVLKRVIGPLTASPEKMWLLSIVAKEDLWDSDSQIASRFYTEGEYANLLDIVSKAKGAVNFRHELVRASLVISNFETSKSERLKKNTEGYDHRRSVESLRRLLEAVNSLREWEASS